MQIGLQPYPFNNGTVSTTNSSTANLGIAGVFTGAWIDTLDYSGITVAVKSDKAGSLVIQRSSTGLSVGSTATYPYTLLDVGMKVGLGVGGRYLRIVYTNGAAATTTFSLNTYLHINPTGFSFQQIDEPQLDNTYALNTLSVVSGKRLNDGVHGVVPLAADNSMFVTSVPYVYAIAEGDIPAHTIKMKMGYHPAATAAETTLWNPGTQYVFMTGATAVEALSSSAADTSAGAGAKTVHMNYLTTGYVESSFTFTMNGVTPVAGPVDVFRINSFHVGTGAAAVGTINVRLVGGAATIYSQIAAGNTRAMNSVYTVPIGKTFYVENIFFSVAYSSAGKSEKMTFHASKNPEGIVSTSGILFWPYFEAMLVDGMAYDPSESPLLFPEKTDIKVSVIGETNAKCTARYTGWLE